MYLGFTGRNDWGLGKQTATMAEMRLSETAATPEPSETNFKEYSKEYFKEYVSIWTQRAISKCDYSI